nr:uncharacterized protein LOC113803467 isoform X2 [Penaeus vannamei]
MATFDDAELYRHPQRFREPISPALKEEVYANFKFSWFWKDHQNKKRIQQILDERYNFVPERPYVASRAFYQNVTRVRVTCIYCTCDLLTYDILQAHNAGRKHKKHFEGVEINGLGQSGSHRTNELQQMANASGAINRDLSASGHKSPVNELKPLMALELSTVNHRQTVGQHNHSDASVPQTPAVARRKTHAPTTVWRSAKKRKSSRM